MEIKMAKKQTAAGSSRVITYERLPGSGRKFGRADEDQCQKWVMTTFTFGLEVRRPDRETETQPHTVNAFAQHRGSVEPSLYMTPAGKWFYRTAWHDEPGIVPRPPRFVEVCQE